jgi:hypothetical protein
MCRGLRKIPETAFARRRRRKILIVASIAGVPAMSAFTPLLEPFRNHAKLFGIVSFLFYLFAVVVLVVAAFVAGRKPADAEADVPTG